MPQTVYADHPIASIFPLMPKSDLQSLADDIKANGLNHPIVMYEGKVLDGRNRAKACEIAGVTPTYKDFAGSDPWAFVWSENAARRHLSAGETAIVAAEFQRGSSAWAAEREMVRAGANKRRSVEKEGNTNAAKPEKQTGLLLDLTVWPARPSPVSPTPAKPKTDTLARAASAAGVSRATYAQATALLDRAPALAAKVKAGETTLKQATATMKRAEIVERAAVETKAAPAPGLVRDLAFVAGRYRTIYADPPWEYDDGGSRGSAAQHYPTANLDDLSAIPVGALAHQEGAHLWLWTTWPKIRDGAPQRLLDAWGFAWSGEIVWDKQRIGTGRYLRSQTEVLILGVKNKLGLLESDQGGFHGEARSGHSEKPAWFANTIKRLSPGPRIELFARSAREAWDRWGNEA